jgi:type I protein arginine methyltransferase
MYSVHAYGKMMTDSIRMEAYDAAMKRAIEPGMVVLDIGTGTGIHALMAARLGAKHVYAVEPADSVELAPEIARKNGLGDRITFMRGLSTQIEIPERADVVISDLHGTLPWYKQHIPTIVDARRRLMEAGGMLIPQRDDVYAVPVEAPDLYSKYATPWRDQPYGFDFSLVASKITNAFSRGRVDEDGFLASVEHVAELDYASIENPAAQLSFSVPALRDGTMHGVMVWFDTTLIEDVRLSSAPFATEISYGSTFFPLSEPVHVEAGDEIRFELRGVLQSDYVWTWNCEVYDRDGARKASFRQNTLKSEFISLDSLKKRAPAFQPRLSPDGEVDGAILSLMDGHRSVADIAREVHGSFESRFTDEASAMERVRELSERYG